MTYFELALNIGEHLYEEVTILHLIIKVIMVVHLCVCETHILYMKEGGRD